MAGVVFLLGRLLNLEMSEGAAMEAMVYLPMLPMVF